MIRPLQVTAAKMKGTLKPGTVEVRLHQTITVSKAVVVERTRRCEGASQVDVDLVRKQFDSHSINVRLEAASLCAVVPRLLSTL